MSEQIARHIETRGDTWKAVDAPIQLAHAIEKACSEHHSVVVDCLTLWLSNIMLAELDVEKEVQKLLASVSAVTTPLVIVSNEVGMGIAPESALDRKFRDEQGRLNQAMAGFCKTVEFVAAGLPLRLKGQVSSSGAVIRSLVPTRGCERMRTIDLYQ